MVRYSHSICGRSQHLTIRVSPLSITISRLARMYKPADTALLGRLVIVLKIQKYHSARAQEAGMKEMAEEFVTSGAGQITRPDPGTRFKGRSSGCSPAKSGSYQHHPTTVPGGCFEIITCRWPNYSGGEITRCHAAIHLPGHGAFPGRQELSSLSWWALARCR